jgi:hypothetical protein
VAKVFSAFVLALLATGCDDAPSKQGRKPVNETDVHIPHVVPQSSRRMPWSECAQAEEGIFHISPGNRWTKDAMFCLNGVEAMWQVFQDPSLGYSLSSARCPDLKYSGDFSPPKNVFHLPLRRQITIWKRGFIEDLREFARRCGVEIDTTRLADKRFDKFYIDFGEGRWFRRDENGRIHLTPNPPQLVFDSEQGIYVYEKKR